MTECLGHPRTASTSCTAPGTNKKASALLAHQHNTNRWVSCDLHICKRTRNLPFVACPLQTHLWVHRQHVHHLCLDARLGDTLGQCLTQAVRVAIVARVQHSNLDVYDVCVRGAGRSNSEEGRATAAACQVVYAGVGGTQAVCMYACLPACRAGCNTAGIPLAQLYQTTTRRGCELLAGKQDVCDRCLRTCVVPLPTARLQSL